MDNIQMAEQIKSIVAFLYRVNPDDSSQALPIGTGFFVSRVFDEVNLPNSEMHVRGKHLITAKHVLGELEEIWIRVNLLAPNDAGNYFAVYRSKRDEWLVSPDADVALLKSWAPNPGEVAYNTFPAAGFATRSHILEHEIAEGAEVFIPGLFHQHTGSTRNSVLIRHGRIALITDDKMDWPGGPESLHLIEAQVFPGVSGSPGLVRQVHIDGSGTVELWLLGLVKGSYLSPQIIRTPEAQLQTSENAGIAALVPADKILELLSSTELVEYHQQLVDRLPPTSRAEPEA